MADRELLMTDEPNNPRNRRISVVLMRGSYYRDPKAAPTTKSLLSVPDSKVKKDEPVTQQGETAPVNTKSAGPSIFDNESQEEEKNRQGRESYIYIISTGKIPSENQSSRAVPCTNRGRWIISLAVGIVTY